MSAKVNDHICAILLEVVQGEGGVLALEPTFLSQVQQLCDAKDILLIIDEVQTGIGRCGSLFAYERYGLHPDIVMSFKQVIMEQRLVGIPWLVQERLMSCHNVTRIYISLSEPKERI